MILLLAFILSLPRLWREHCAFIDALADRYCQRERRFKQFRKSEIPKVVNRKS